MKILIVAYYYPPANGVATKRPSYWHEQLLQNGFDSHVVTATQQLNNSDLTITYIPTDSSVNILIKDAGTSWKNPLKKFFVTNDKHYDVVILTGGPFMHFGITSVIRKCLPNVKIILDFRDPFAINPRFGNSGLKTKIKKYFEDNFIDSADYIITVNEYCVKLLGLSGVNYSVINNGFDERITDSVKPLDNFKLNYKKLNIVYAGRFAKDRDPSNFINVLLEYPKIADLHYVGDNLIDVATNTSQVINHGNQSYNKTISILKSCDYGIIFTSGSEFESTTKIFDYMACNLKILIVSPTGIPGGSLNDITTDYPGVVWIKDDISAIYQSLHNMINEDLNKHVIDCTKYSRYAGFLKLQDILNKLL